MNLESENDGHNSNCRNLEETTTSGDTVKLKAEQKQEEVKPGSAPKIFDISSFQKFASEINGTLGGKDWSSSDDDDADSSSSKNSVASSSSSSPLPVPSDDDSAFDPGIEPRKFVAFHDIQSSTGNDESRDNKRNQHRGSITLGSLARGNSSRNLQSDSIADIATALAMKQELAKQGVRFADEVDEKEISKLRQSCMNLLFYMSSELADFRHQAFMEDCGLDPNEFE